jgi:hypothetical protein
MLQGRGYHWWVSSHRLLNIGRVELLCFEQETVLLPKTSLYNPLKQSIVAAIQVLPSSVIRPYYALF